MDLGLAHGAGDFEVTANQVIVCKKNPSRGDANCWFLLEVTGVKASDNFLEGLERSVRRGRERDLCDQNGEDK